MADSGQSTATLRLKVGELARYEDPAALDLMRRIKRAIDPQGIMNPGKVLDAGV